MMEKIYKKPVMKVERFVANEYVAACGDENLVYKFVCDAPNKGKKFYYYPNSDGKIDGIYTGGGKPSVAASKSYVPCNTAHIVSVNSLFYDGFIDYNGNGRPDQGEGVIVWAEDEGLGAAGIYNFHATTQLRQDSWETAKS